MVIAMNTAEMWLKAQEDRQTYRSGDMFYSKSIGFHDLDGSKWDPSAFKTINDIMECQWKPVTVLTKKDAEAKFDIIIID